MTLKKNKNKFAKNLKLNSLMAYRNIRLTKELYRKIIASKTDVQEQHLKFLEKREQYLEKIEKANLDKFDLEFVDFYRKGKIEINKKVYNLDDLYIEEGTVEGKKINILVDFHQMKYDIITETKYPDFKRNKINLFKNSTFLKEIYKKYSTTNKILIIDFKEQDELKETLKNYNYSMQLDVPETYYLRYEE